MNAYQVFSAAEKPVVDREALKQRLHELSKQYHPNQESSDNRVDSTRWHEINEAYLILTDDVSRLKHLLELAGEQDLNASTSVPEEVMSLFSTVGPALHRADEVIDQIDQAESALEQAMLQAEVMTLAIDLQQIAAQVGEYRSRVLNAVAQLDDHWLAESPTESMRSELKALYRQLIYIARWAKQLDEKLFRVMNF